MSTAAEDNQPETSDTAEIGVDELMRTIECLERIAEDRGVLLPLGKADRDRLVRAASKVSHPGRAARRQIQNAHKQQRREAIASK